MAGTKSNIANINEIISSIKFNSASRSDMVLEAIINAIIRPHVLHEISYYRKMKKVSAGRYNIITLSIILTSSGLPLVIMVCNKDTNLNWIPILISSVTTILTTVNYVFNIKHEWQSNLSSYENLKGVLTEWILGVLAIQYGTLSEDEKTTAYFSLTANFLKEFNDYEMKEITDHFSKMREVEQSKNDQKVADNNSQPSGQESKSASGAGL